jgi:voltage-gated potassium channel
VSVRAERSRVAKVQQRIWMLLNYERNEDAWARVTQVFLTVLIALNVLADIVESEPAMHPYHATIFYPFELFSVAVFSIEYALRLWTCVAAPDRAFRDPVLGRLRFALSMMALIDLLAILPFYLSLLEIIDLRFLRVLRLLRLLKLTRYSAAFRLLSTVLKREAQALGAVLFIMLVMLVLVSGIMYELEHEVQPQAFGSIGSAMWWGVVTLTTVGYGDVVPHTIPGKIFGGCVAVVGVGTLALLSGVLTVGFIDALRQRQPRGRSRASDLCPHCGKPTGVSGHGASGHAAPEGIVGSGVGIVAQLGDAQAAVQALGEDPLRD